MPGTKKGIRRRSFILSSGGLTGNIGKFLGPETVLSGSSRRPQVKRSQFHGQAVGKQGLAEVE